MTDFMSTPVKVTPIKLTAGAHLGVLSSFTSESYTDVTLLKLNYIIANVTHTHSYRLDTEETRQGMYKVLSILAAYTTLEPGYTPNELLNTLINTKAVLTIKATHGAHDKVYLDPQLPTQSRASSVASLTPSRK